jgi:hypothetical protein
MNKIFTMWNLRKIVFICLLFFALNSISAQTTNFQFGAKGGLNLSTALVNDASAIKLRPGYYIGGTVDYLLTPKFELQSGLFLSKQGSIIEDLNSSSYDGGTPGWTHTFNQLYLQIPLYVAFRKNISNDWDMTIGFGPYFGYGIGGKTNKKLNNGIYGDGSTKTEWDTFGNGIYDESRDWLKGEYLNPFDFGAGIKLDVEYKKIIFGIGLETSIIDIMNNEDDEDLNYRNINIRLSVGYRF